MTPVRDFDLILTGAPSGDIVTLDEVKAHLRVDYTDHDALISTYLAAAVEQLDGYEGDLRQCLLTQTWQMRLNGGFPPFARAAKIPLGPVASIESVTYVDADGNSQTLDPSLYGVFNLGGVKSEAFLAPAPGTNWPATRCQFAAVTITFIAGFGETADVPARIKAAVFQMVADMYRSPEAYVRQPVTQNPVLSRLLAAFVRDTL